MVTEYQNLVLWLQRNRERCHGYRETKRVGVVTVNKTRCHSYRITERFAIVTE
jgi:hypothetical protein